MVVEITVGRHAADDVGPVHPLVAAALEARQTPPPGAVPASHRQDGGEGPVGWPGPPGDGTGLGWPEDTDGQERPAPAEAPSSARSGRWLGWRPFSRRRPRARQDIDAA